MQLMTVVAKQLRGVYFFSGLVFFVLAVSYPIIRYNMFYFEQPLMFIANQKIHSWYDLLLIYLHPQIFHIVIPFFRPSGHFLLYQILTPFIGWHNQTALIMVNLLFLSGCGLYVIKIYQRLFPTRVSGGYIALALYLLHPALSLSKLIILHFEFAYVFFALLSCYSMIIFVQANPLQRLELHRKINQSAYLMLSLMAFIIAITFKEAALVMGGVLIAYFIFFNAQTSLRDSMQRLMDSRFALQLMAILLVLTLTLTIYITLAWPTLANPLRPMITWHEVTRASAEFFKIIFCVGNNFTSNRTFGTATLPFRIIIIPAYVRIIWWLSVVITVWVTYRHFYLSKSVERLEVWKNVFFLISAMVITLSLPVLWGMALPWHLSLTLIFLTLYLGLGIESFIESFFSKHHRLIICIIMLGIGLLGYAVNQANVNRYSQDKPLHNLFLLNKNAVLHPPRLKQPLRSDTLLLVGDDTIRASYFFGAGNYPFHDMHSYDYELSKIVQRFAYLPLTSHYNGTLFHWAYLNTQYREELYPFSLSHLEGVPSEMIEDWVLNQDHIVYVTYTDHHEWKDETIRFKHQLAIEQRKRHLSFHRYQYLKNKTYAGIIFHIENLSFPDPKLCRYLCNQRKDCAGFRYVQLDIPQHEVYRCLLMNTFKEGHTLPCEGCLTALVLKDHSSNI